MSDLYLSGWLWYLIYFLLLFTGPLIMLGKLVYYKCFTHDVKPDKDFRDRFQPIFEEGSEYYVSSLGNDFISNYFSTKKVSKGFSVISNKRIYFKGSCYLEEDGKLIKSSADIAADMKDVVGTGLVRRDPVHLLVTAFVSLFLSLITELVDLTNVVSYSRFTADLVLVLVLVSMVVYTCTSIAYAIKRRTLVEIVLSGGKIAFDAKLYDREEIIEFQKKLRMMKTMTEKSKLSIADEIKKYSELAEQGIITEEEFLAVKKDLLYS